MRTTNALITKAAQTIEDLNSFVETTYTSGGGSIPDDVLEQLMVDRALVRELYTHAPGIERLAVNARQLKDAYRAIRIMYRQTLPIVGWALKAYAKDGTVWYGHGSGMVCPRSSPQSLSQRKVFATRELALAERTRLTRAEIDAAASHVSRSYIARIVLVPVRRATQEGS